MCRRAVDCGRMWLWCPRGSRFFLAWLSGSCDREFRKFGGLQGSSPTSWSALRFHVCQQHASCRCVEVGVVGFLCIHLVVVSEREISSIVLSIGELCINMTKSGGGPNGCVSKFQVDVKRVNHIRAVNSRFTHGVAVFVWCTLCCRCVW